MRDAAACLRRGTASCRRYVDGVIGELLTMDKVCAASSATAAGSGDAEGSEDFCQAILTTDLVKKEVCVSLTVDGNRGAYRRSGQRFGDDSSEYGDDARLHYDGCGDRC